MKHTISVHVEDKPGALTRITSMFARRGFNIDSLAVGPTERPGISRITLRVDCAEHTLEQIEKQIHKLVNVLRVTELVEPGERQGCRLDALPSGSFESDLELDHLCTLLDAAHLVLRTSEFVASLLQELFGAELFRDTLHRADESFAPFDGAASRGHSRKGIGE